MTISRRRFFAALTVIGLLATVGAPPVVADGYRLVDPPRPLDGLDLSAKGQSVDRAALAGRWTFMSIGYTHCPDICPTVLSNMAVVQAAMTERLPAGAVPRMMFVSVDPERDNRDWLASYVANFGKDFLGVTGKKSAIDAVVKRLGAFYRLGRKDRDGFYTVDHSAEIYLIDPDVRLRARFMPPLDPKRTLAAYLTISKAAGPPADAAGRVR